MKMKTERLITKNLFQNGFVKRMKITEKHLQANTARSIQRLVTFQCVLVSTPKVFIFQTASTKVLIFQAKISPRTLKRVTQTSSRFVEDNCLGTHPYVRCHFIKSSFRQTYWRGQSLTSNRRAFHCYKVAIHLPLFHWRNKSQYPCHQQYNQVFKLTKMYWH